MKIYLSFMLLFAVAAYADVGDQDTEKLIRAKSTKEVLKTTDEATQLRLMRASCEAQQFAKQIPAACFQAIQFELRSGLVNRTEAESFANGYAASCEERINKQTSPEILDLALKQEALPKRCRELVDKRRKELLYIMSAGDLNISRRSDI
jgi:hypothetical protein